MRSSKEVALLKHKALQDDIDWFEEFFMSAGMFIIHFNQRGRGTERRGRERVKRRRENAEQVRT